MSSAYINESSDMTWDEENQEAMKMADKLTNMAQQIFAANKEKGFWDYEKVSDRNMGELVALIHSELSEAQESFPVRVRDDKLTERSAVHVEIADAIIRTLDLIGAYGIGIYPEDFWLEHVASYHSDAMASLFDDVSLAHMFASRVLEAHRKGSEMDWSEATTQLLGYLLAICWKHEIDIMPIVEEKLAYNKTRPYKHGKSY